jgi:arginyl-tRNA--protein-N-Asp/Glu arginylyltransferase
MKNSHGGQQQFTDYGVFRRSQANDKLTKSTCKKCRSFVAASVRPELLDFIEKLHLCILQGHSVISVSHI